MWCIWCLYCPFWSLFPQFCNHWFSVRVGYWINIDLRYFSLICFWIASVGFLILILLLAIILFPCTWLYYIWCQCHFLTLCWSPIPLCFLVPSSSWCLFSGFSAFVFFSFSLVVWCGISSDWCSYCVQSNAFFSVPVPKSHFLFCHVLLFLFPGRFRSRWLVGSWLFGWPHRLWYCCLWANRKLPYPKHIHYKI